MPDDEFRLSEFRKALRQDARGQVVDLDKNYTHKFNFQIHRYEHVLQNSRMFSPPNRWSYHRIGLLRQGEGELVTGIYKFSARKNTLVVIPSRVVTSSRNWSSDVKGYILLFNIDFFLENNFSHELIRSKKVLTTSIRPYIHLNDDQAGKIAEIFETILLEKHAEHDDKNELIAVKIIELLVIIERLFQEELGLAAHPPSIEILRNFIALLDTHFTKQHSVKYYAEKLLIHPNHLNALIKKHTGLSAKESIRNKLLLETKYLLHSTKSSIKQISNEMGFRDPNNFSSFFARFEKLSPANYRSVFC